MEIKNKKTNKALNDALKNFKKMFRNGTLRMSLSDIARATGANQGGLVLVYLVLEADVASIGSPTAQVVSTITMESGKVFSKYGFTEETGKFVEPMQGETDGHSFRQQIDFIIAKDSAAVAVAINAMIGQRFIIIYQDANGSKKIMGSKLQPVRMIKADLDSGDTAASRNHHAFSLVSDANYPAFFFSGSVPLT